MEATAAKGISSWTLVLFSYLLLACAVGAVQHDTRVKTRVETTYVLGALPPAYGNLTLPEPTLINHYLRTNTTLTNYLLPSNPPLQLIKCEAYLLQLGVLFNFYVVEHTEGCQVPPPMAPWPERAYSNIGRFWFFTVRSWLCSGGWLGVLVLVTTTIWFTKKFRDICIASNTSRYIHDDLLFVIFISILVSALFSLVLTIVWLDNVAALRSFDLPDPDVTGMNPFLHNSNVSLSLHRCKGRIDSRPPRFDFYIGMPKQMCAQMLAARAPYGDDLLEDPETGGLGFIAFVSPFAKLSCTAILLFEVYYLASYVG